MVGLLKVTYRFNAIPTKIPDFFFSSRNDNKLIITFKWRCKGPAAAAAAAKSLQSCPTLCDPIDGSPAGSPVPGILQARILEWVAISFSNTCTHVKSL